MAVSRKNHRTLLIKLNNFNPLKRFFYWPQNHAGKHRLIEIWILECGIDLYFEAF